MAKKPETIFKEKVISDLLSQPYCHVEKIQQVALVGTPDLLGCWNGRFFAIELKSSAGAKVKPIQAHVLSLYREAGGITLITWPEIWWEHFINLKLLCGTNCFSKK